MRPLVMMLALGWIGCGDDTGPTPTADYFVNRATGSDGNTGTSGAPFKTITKALSVADSGEVIQVLPGRYDVTNGEAFPLEVPLHVSLIGDEANKGGGGTPTAIVGGGQYTTTTLGTAVALRPFSVLAGFTIVDSAVFTIAMGVYVNGDAVTIRNNRVVNSIDFGLLFEAPTIDHVIRGNIISGHDIGIVFAGGGTGSRIESNTITNNATGVEYAVAGGGGDLGGGSAGSTGGNILSCNTNTDVFSSSNLTVSAANNRWDHVPPTTGPGGGEALISAPAPPRLR